MLKLQVGDQAPIFQLQDQNGIVRKLTDYKGQWVLLYFYPKDDTPGCTKEACAFRDQFPHFEKLKVIVLGISVDSVDSHKKFKQKYNLPFILLSDFNKEVVKQYGVWGRRTFMGRIFLGTKRTSFLINPQGKIVKIYENVKPAIHADEVLNDLLNLQNSRQVK
jgi:peroxiredoxin Q/BCP